MGKLEKLAQRFRAERAANKEMEEKLDQGMKAAKKAAKAMMEEGQTIGALYAAGAALGTVVTDRVLYGLSERYPSLKRWRKFIDFGIGVVLYLLSKVHKGLGGLAIAGMVWIAIQLFGFIANKMGLATGFSVEAVEGMQITNNAGQTIELENDELELALFADVLAGMEDETAYHLAEAAETGVIGTAIAVALPEVLKLAQEYGPGAAQMIQNVIKRAQERRARKLPPKAVKAKMLEQREARKRAHREQMARELASRTLAQQALTPAPALPEPQTPAPNMLAELQTSIRQELRHILPELTQTLVQQKKDAEAYRTQAATQQAATQQAATQQAATQQAATPTQAEEVEGIKERMERREARREERREDRRENWQAWQQAAATQQAPKA